MMLMIKIQAARKRGFKVVKSFGEKRKGARFDLYLRSSRFASYNCLKNKNEKQTFTFSLCLFACAHVKKNKIGFPCAIILKSWNF
jgi:hypothetical protein